MPTPRSSRSTEPLTAKDNGARSIYLDHNATTPVDPEVVSAMTPFFADDFGNAASRTHRDGQRALAAVERAREAVAQLIGTDARSIVWTSGATEANNLAIKGVVRGLREKGQHILTQATEHPSVLDSCQYLREEGFNVQVLPVERSGLLSISTLQQALRKDTVLVSVMLANNETGVIQPVEEFSKVCHLNGTLVHCDATQAAGKLGIDIAVLGVDLLSLSAHKMYGPKGVGALFVRGGSPKVRLAPLLHGGGHERGMRSGTLNVAGIVGFGRACELAKSRLRTDTGRIADLRSRFEDGLQTLPGTLINGAGTPRLPNTTSVSFEGVDAEAALVAMPELSLSTGSACTTTSVEPSHVLTAMGIPETLIRGTLRASIGRGTTASHIKSAISIIHTTVSRLRALRHAC